MSAARGRSFASSPLVAFLVFLGAIAALRWHTLREPPVWDCAMSVFPAALTLARNGFDLVGLSATPGFWDGGPNTHARSLVTLLTALVIRLTGDGPAMLPTLHVLHWAVAAAALATLYAFLLPLLGALLTAAVSAATLLCPVVLTQAGSVYLETPLLLCTVLALQAWSRDRAGAALLWVALGCWIKEAGVVIAATIALAALLRPGAWTRRLGYVAALVVVPVVLHVVDAVAAPGIAEQQALADVLRTRVWRYVVAVPDVAVLAAAGLVWAAVRAPATWRALRSDTRGGPDVRAALTTLLPVVFVAFYLLAQAVAVVWVLPRYWVQAVPFLLAGLAAAARRALPSPAPAVLMLAVAGWFVANRDGAFYPALDTVPEFSVAERSGEYADVLALQRQGIRTILDLPASVPVYYGLPEHFFLQYPAMGYADRTPANGRLILADRSALEDGIAAFPSTFYMYVSLNGLGGVEMLALAQQAARDPERRVRPEPIEHAGHRAYLLRVDTVGG